MTADTAIGKPLAPASEGEATTDRIRHALCTGSSRSA
jgi:hypothetical protein